MNDEIGMGRKRKKAKSSSSDSSASGHESTTYDPNDPNTTVSGALNSTNKVLYEQPLTSTPMGTNEADPGGIHRKLDLIMLKLENMEKLETRLDERLTRMDKLVRNIDSRVQKVEKSNVEFEKSVTFVSGQVDVFYYKCKKMEKTVKTVSDQMTKFAGKSTQIDKLVQDFEEQNTKLAKYKAQLDKVVEERDMLQNTVVDLQCRSMKTNLIFTGLSGETNTENTESKLRDFLYYELGIEENIEFGNVHRYGKKVHGKNRPIVARFLFQRDLKRVKKWRTNSKEVNSV